MRLILYPILMPCVVACLAFTAPVFAAVPPAPDYAADAQRSSDNPPLIPHAVKPDQNGAACTICHRTGVRNAPVSDHPERLNCTQCHVQGDVKEDASKDGKQ
ncbi:MAG: hypothetical protein HXX11_01670 [Desulfuromonadales bacterium]|nr:hypothetical protein [Desulfuromonadales bacterium]